MLDIEYLDIRTIAQMRTQYSVGANSKAYIWSARETQKRYRVCYRQNLLPTVLPVVNAQYDAVAVDGNLDSNQDGRLVTSLTP